MQGIKVVIGLFLFVGLGISACGKQELVPSEYVSWVNDKSNNLLKEKTVYPLTVEVLYKPIPYIIANEKRTNDIKKREYETRKKELEGLQYYTLKISTAEGDITNYKVTNKAEQDERYNYLSFAMKNDVVLQVGEEILPCKLFHFERSYDLVNYRSFVLAFEIKEVHKNKDKTLILDLPYFQTGPIKLNYKTSDLDQIPNLKL